MEQMDPTGGYRVYDLVYLRKLFSLRGPERVPQGFLLLQVKEHRD